ncbi:hypothetical protein K437DRAFT_185794 [Tilletiaria anomala UBC 951]|uniref:Uncharacterized protein n=1 Tax=Tilletiaria anomala (strain ATCC 24038 / CBS 436.72 / UBC 951) TaxID=1037660 RepID=A0A066WFE8_TILAU|nr:uncharacterized protein K437DRAFT_185794 [Tilletiaria anomala UBC 951]KDN52506.1 hypothetical protein K437DRAFT_185794 [Tilletiaria anomala UBC 951]
MRNACPQHLQLPFSVLIARPSGVQLLRLVMAPNTADTLPYHPYQLTLYFAMLGYAFMLFPLNYMHSTASALSPYADLVVLT